MEIAKLAARAVVGSLFIGHGTQKLVGAFGGPGLAGTDQMMRAIGLHPPRRNSLAAGVTETTGGALLAAGLATPLAAAALTGVMTTAIRKVHLRNGPWVANGGYEYNLVLIATAAALAERPGDLSLDALLGRREWGPRWALGAVAAGVAASTVVIELGKRAAPPPAAEAPQAAPEPPDAAGDPTTEN